MRKFFAALAVVSVLATTAACSNQTVTAANPEKVSAALQPFYIQKLTWSDCGAKMVCTFVAVPLNWQAPSTKNQLKLAVVMHQAQSANGKFLFTNPGGPGASGYDFVHDSLVQVATQNLIDEYNIVGFDPRGVDRSNAVTCLNFEETDKFLYADSGYPYGSAKDFAASKIMISNFVSSCQAQTGVELKYLDTVSAARDLDVLRAVVGSSKLNYLGFSYGTFLGNTYATLYPKTVGRMVLDGAEDPSESVNQKNLSQVKAFDLELRSYLADCLSQTGCPFKGTVDSSLTRIQKLLISIETKPLPTKSKRELTIAAATTGILLSLYSNTFWSLLSTGFTEAFAGKGDTLLRLADIYNDRSPQGDFLTNGLEAYYAVTCLDDAVDGSAAAMAKQNKLVLAASPTLGRYWQYGALVCSMWPYPAVKGPPSYAAEGSPTILVVGTTKDPATPYSQAVRLANKILANGFLVTFNGDGHTAYGRGNSCVNDAVDAFLLEGKLPIKDPQC